MNTNVELEIMCIYIYFNGLETLGRLCYFGKISF